MISDLEYLCWRRKNFPVSSDLKPPLENFIRTVKGQNNFGNRMLVYLVLGGFSDLIHLDNSNKKI